jgi:hypothetical protein
MSEIKYREYDGGRKLSQLDGLDKDMRDIADDLAGIQSAAPAAAVTASDVAANNVVFEGLTAEPPTTPSSQLTGAGNTTWNIDVSLGAAIVNSIEETFAVQADYAVHSGSKLLDNGQAIYTWLLLAESGGTVAFTTVDGTAATSGSEVAPTDTEITTGVGHANWIKIALLHLHRDGDTSLAQTESNVYKDMFLGVAGIALINSVKSLLNDIRGKLNTAATYTVTHTKG